jgi:hypothetical protein
VPAFRAIIDVRTSVRVMVGGGITASRLLGDLSRAHIRPKHRRQIVFSNPVARHRGR